MRKFVVAVLCLVSVGCGSGGDKWTKARPKTTPVRGIVLLDGNPIDGATINFIANGGSHSGFGMTNVHGQFELTTFEDRDGVVPGDYFVTVVKHVVDVEHNPEAPFILPPLKYEEKDIVPVGYNTPEKSKLIAHVSEGENAEFRFELSGKGPVK